MTDIMWWVALAPMLLVLGWAAIAVAYILYLMVSTLIGLLYNEVLNGLGYLSWKK